MAASERAYLERESKEYDRKLLAWKEEAKLLGSWRTGTIRASPCCGKAPACAPAGDP